MKDVIVIGAGLSGLMSALALADAGLRPLVVAKGQGTTHWTSGTVDILGTQGDTTLHAALEELLTTQPDHPYSRVGRTTIVAALDRFRAATEEARYPYAGSLQRNMLLPTALGALRPAAFAPLTMIGGDTRTLGKVLVAGFHELRDFYPPMLAGNLRAQGIDARPHYLTVPPAFRRAEYTTRTFAHLFEQSAFRAAIGEQLRAHRDGATHIALPAVLGVQHPTAVLHDLQSATHAQIFEIPTIPPSVPGMRLFNLLQRTIEERGGQVQLGAEVVDRVADGTRLTAVLTEAAARTQRHPARAFVLATGGIAGGGIHTDHHGTVRETALDLPLQAPQQRSDWFVSRFVHEDGHPIFAAGVATDQHFRPVNATRTVVYDNVVVAGSALAAPDILHARALSGLAICTGWHAGTLLAQTLTNGETA